MNKLSDYNIQTVVRAVRLCQELNDLPLSQTFEMLLPVFGVELIDAAKDAIEEDEFQSAPNRARRSR